MNKTNNCAANPRLWGVPIVVEPRTFAADMVGTFPVKKVGEISKANDIFRKEKRKLVNKIWQCTDAVKLAEIKKVLGM